MFKKIKVVMLPTEKASFITKRVKTGELLYSYKIFANNSIYGEAVNINQHLYFLSDEEIKMGDWLLADGYKRLSPKNQHLSIAKADEGQFAAMREGYTAKKITASTDESLGLPRPSDKFIKKYCELDGIEEVQIEYKEIETGWSIGSDGTGKNDYYYDWQPKVAPDNTITIKSAKNSWNKEEIYNLIKNFNSDAGSYNRINETSQLPESLISNWLEENI